MRKSQYSDEQIVKIVRESHAQGVAETAKKYKVSENAIYIWRRKFGGMEPNQVSELKRIMQENARLKKIVAERDLEIEVMKEIAAKQPTRSAAGRRISAHAGREIRHKPGIEPATGLPAAGAHATLLTYAYRMPERDAPLQQAIAGVVAAHPTWGIRLIHGWLCGQGMVVPFSRLRRVYRQAGYAAQWRKRRKKIRRQQRINPVAQQPHDVWCMDFAEDRLINGRRFMALLVKDEATSYGLAIRVAPSFKSIDVESILDELVAKHGCPQFIRSDNGGQFISFAIQRWAQTRNISLAYIQPGKPWQNGFAESFVGTYRTEVLNADVFHSIDESGVVSSAWLHMYNHERPHSKHNYQPPVSAFTKNAA